MNKVLLFGGTGEGRALAEWMVARDIPHTVCVATEYGETLLPAGAEAHVGRMDSGEMEALMRAGGYSLAVDATHPYAVEVTEHIRAAAEAAGLPVLRLVRQPDGGELCRRAKDMAGAADMLEQMPGHVLLTTGSKELHHFARPGLAERCYPRVLPMADSLERCLTLGFPPKNIICMQGPFSRELNVALLRQYHIQTLVTKDTGGYGGFREKAEAAREAGCALLVVERPSRETGLALEAIGDSPVLVGAPRLLEPWGAEHDCVPLIAAADIAAYVDKAPRGPVGVLLSGDTGFYSGAKGLWPLLGNHEVITIPGISSLSYFCARLQTTWQDARLVSAHGRSHNAVGEIQRSAKVFALTGGATKAEDICRALAERGLGQVRVSVGERLSYADERIVTGTAAELAGETFADLSVLLVVNPDPVVRPWNGSGLPGGAFLRGDVPMTKEEVRALALSKLRLEAHHVVWDVGAGTGSVSVECALSCPAGRVYAVEKKEEALALLAENRARFHAANLEVVAGTAPEALEALSAPDRVFLGGTSGSLEDILNVIFRKNPAARVVCTAVTLETVGEAARCFAGLEGADMVQVAVTRTRPAGRYHLMDAQNPVWIFSGEGRA